MADYRNDDTEIDPEEEAAGLAGDDFDDFDPEEAERESARAFATGGRIPSRGLLSSYDRLRERIIASLEKRLNKRGGRMTEGAVRAP